MSDISSLNNENELNQTLFKKYDDLVGFNGIEETQIKSTFKIELGKIRKISSRKILGYISQNYLKCKLDYNASEFRKLRMADLKKEHPMKPLRGEIYNAYITTNVGSEISGMHPVVVLSNAHTNIYADKINVLPIEGDGRKVPSYLASLTDNDLEYGNLLKNPSRIIIPEILTIDKARLGVKVGKINNSKMLEINKKIAKQLSL
ncbi:MAG: type II toxin-antitoxin system PemK/MazF family toxin [Solirubrobacterales bacterium]